MTLTFFPSSLLPGDKQTSKCVLKPRVAALQELSPGWAQASASPWGLPGSQGVFWGGRTVSHLCLEGVSLAEGRQAAHSVVRTLFTKAHRE